MLHVLACSSPSHSCTRVPSGSLHLGHSRPGVQAAHTCALVGGSAELALFSEAGTVALLPCTTATYPMQAQLPAFPQPPSCSAEVLAHLLVGLGGGADGVDVVLDGIRVPAACVCEAWGREREAWAGCWQPVGNYSCGLGNANAWRLLRCRPWPCTAGAHVSRAGAAPGLQPGTWVPSTCRGGGGQQQGPASVSTGRACSQAEAALAENEKRHSYAAAPLLPSKPQGSWPARPSSHPPTQQALILALATG